MVMSQMIVKTVLSNFENDKQLTEDNVALIIAAKKRIYNKRKKNLNIFVIHHEEYLDFYFLINKLIHNLSSSVFQLLIKTSGSSDAPEGHWGFGECAWCATTQELKIFIADPLGLFHSEDILLDMQKSGFNFEELSKKVNLTVYLGYDKIQFSNNDCFYISLDAAFMLVKQYYFESLYQPNQSLKDYFIKNCELDLPFKFKIEILELPYRLLRITQSIKLINEKLEKKPFLGSYKVTIKGKQFINSIFEKSILTQFKPHNNKKINIRNHLFKEKMFNIVKNYIALFNNEEEMIISIKNQRLEGLDEFIQSKPAINAYRYSI